MAESLGADWPGCAQVFRLTRERKTGEKVETEVVHGIASLPRERAGARELLELTRGHWGIENGLHGVRDGTLREDASRIRRGSATQVMAIVRNIVIFSSTSGATGAPRPPRVTTSATPTRHWKSCQDQSENETALGSVAFEIDRLSTNF